MLSEANSAAHGPISQPRGADTRRGLITINKIVSALPTGNGLFHAHFFSLLLSRIAALHRPGRRILSVGGNTTPHPDCTALGF